MVFIDVVNQNPIVLDCHKHTKDGDFFRLVIDPRSKEIVEKPDVCDIDVSAAYSRIFGYMLCGKPLPKHTIAEWG